MQEALAQPVVQLSPPFLRRHYRTIIVVSLLIADLISITLGFYLAYRVRLALPIPDQAQGVSRFLSLMPLLLVQAISIITAFFFAKMYHRNRTRYSTDELQAILSGVSIGTLISIAVSAFTFKANFDYPRVMIIYAWIFTGVLVIVLRAVQAQAQRTLQARGYGRTRPGPPSHRRISAPRADRPRLGPSSAHLAFRQGDDERPRSEPDRWVKTNRRRREPVAPKFALWTSSVGAARRAPC